MLGTKTRSPARAAKVLKYRAISLAPKFPCVCWMLVEILGSWKLLLLIGLWHCMGFKGLCIYSSFHDLTLFKLVFLLILKWVSYFLWYCFHFQYFSAMWSPKTRTGGHPCRTRPASSAGLELHLWDLWVLIWVWNISLFTFYWVSP